MDMTREIRIEEGKLKVVFEIQENGVVELKQFDSAGRMDVKERDRGEEDFYPITEVQITGRGTRGMHAYKHNVSFRNGRVILCNFQYLLNYSLLLEK